jgi:hypothetical protein
MAKITFIFLFFPILVICQIKEARNKNNNISISYDQFIYQKIATDTIKKMYENQKKMHEYSNTLGSEAISNKFNLNELTILVIPKFRLKRIANELYECDKNIENFIEFEEKYKYMSAILINDKKYVAMQTVPHPYFEIERINAPDLRLKVDKFVYEESILKNFMSNEFYLKAIQKDIEERNNNFFFGIYGLWDVIFEIDNETGLLYANKYDYNTTIHLPANDYLRKYEGQTKIRELARGYYEDIDGLGTLDPKPCHGTAISKKQITLKVIKVNREN